jgi:cytochrome c oxidase assembly protein subunit 15
MNEARIQSIRFAHALLTAVSMLALICLGGLVTSHGVGMAVPDWPNTYGYNMFFFPISQWVGGIFYEHTHRLLGSWVGLLVLVQMIWLQGAPARRWLRGVGLFIALASFVGVLMAPAQGDWGWMGVITGVVGFGVSWVWPRCKPASRVLRLLGVVLLVGVILQGVLGGLRVVLMRDGLGVFHGTLGQMLLFLSCAIALMQSGWWLATREAWDARPASGSVGYRGLVLATAVAIFFQLILGASMRHRHSGLAVPDFPLAYGRLWPATDAEALARYNRERPELRAVNMLEAADIHLHMTHRLAGCGIVVLLTWVAVRTRRVLGGGHILSRGTILWAAMGYVQVLLGAITVWSNKSADLTTVHVAVGCMLLVVGWLLVVLAWRRGEVVRGIAAGGGAGVPVCLAEAGVLTR